MRETRFGSGRLAFAVLLAAVWFLSLRPAVDWDYGWHVANGRHLGDGVLLGGVDRYSWTAEGATWVAHEWTTEVVMAIAHDAVGPSGNSLLAAAITAMAMALVGWRVRRRGFGWAPTTVTVAIAFAATLVSIGVRPQLLELLYLAATLLWVDLRLADRIGRAAFLAGVAIGAAVWANSHGSFPLLPGVLAAGAVGAVLIRSAAWRDLAGAAIVAAIVPVVNPWGPQLYAFAIQSLSSSTTQMLIEEWRRPALLEPSFLPFTLELLLATAAIVLTLRTAGRARPTAAVRPDDVTVALAVAALGLQSGRHVMLFGIAAAPLVATSVAALAARVRSVVPPRPRAGAEVDPRARDAINAVAFAVIALALAVAGWSLVSPAAQEAATARRYPVGLLDDLDAAAAPGTRLLNEYSWGGFLLLHRPDVPVFIDGRSEVYGDAQLARYAALVRLEPGWQRVLDDLGVNAVLMPSAAPLTMALREAGWSESGSDDVGVLLLRP